MIYYKSINIIEGEQAKTQDDFQDGQLLFNIILHALLTQPKIIETQMKRLDSAAKACPQ